MSELTLFPPVGDSDPGTSAFDRIRHVDENGEHWFGRELQVLMGYANWRDFAATIGRAHESLMLVQGVSAGQSNFASTRKNARVGFGDRDVEDYRLTRFAAYLVAMAGDDSKIQVAAARVYFAVRTREAETAPVPAPGLSDLLGRTELSNRQYIQLVTDTLSRLAETEERLAVEAATRQQAEERIARDAPRVEWVDQFVRPDADYKLVRALAQQVQVPEGRLRSWMIERRLIYIVKCDRRGHTCYRPYATVSRADWWFMKDQPEAPRHSDGSLRQTLMVTPKGCVGVATLLDQYPVDGGWH